MNNNIIGWSYEQMATGRLAMLRSMMDAVINAELLAMVPVIKALLVIWLGRQFLLLMYGLVSTETFITSVIRPAVVVFLIGHTGQFVHYVRDPLFDTIPRAVSSTILSAAGIQTRSTEAISTQFDAMAAGVDMLSSRALALNTSWSASAIANGIGIYMATTGAQILLACVFGIFLLGQTLLAVVLCLGPLVLVFELFERTRPWTSAWLGKMVGLVAFGIGTSLLLAIQMQELHDLIASISANSGNNAADAAGSMVRVASDIVLDFLTMVSLPAAVGFGSAAAGALAGPSLMALRGATGAVGLTGRLAAASARGGRAASNALTRR